MSTMLAISSCGMIAQKHELAHENSIDRWELLLFRRTYSKNRTMNFKPYRLLGPLFSAAFLTDCVLVPDCPYLSACTKSFDLVQWCTSENACKVDDQFCATCVFSRFFPDKKLEFPLDLIRPSLGPRNDFFIEWERDPMGESNFEASFDGVPATADQCSRKPSAQYFVFSCLNLPESIKRLTIKYIPPAGNKDFISAEVQMTDEECYEMNQCGS